MLEPIIPNTNTAPVGTIANKQAELGNVVPKLEQTAITKQETLANKGAQKQSKLDPTTLDTSKVSLDQFVTEGDPAIPTRQKIAIYEQAEANALANEQARETANPTPREFIADTRVDSVLGTALNLGAYVTEGTARVLGQVAAIPFTAQAGDDLGDISDEVRTAFGSVTDYDNTAKEITDARAFLDANEDLNPIEKAKQLAELLSQESKLVAPTEEQIALLDAPAFEEPVEGEVSLSFDIGTGKFNPALVRGSQFQGLTNRQAIERVRGDIEYAGEVSGALTQFTKGLAVDTARDEFTADLSRAYAENKEGITAAKEAYDKGDYVTAFGEGILGVAKLAAAGGMEVLDNPSAISGFVAENIPQLVGGSSKLGAVLTTTGYSLDTFQKGVDAVQKKTGKLPTEAETTEILGWSLGAGLAERLGDVSVLKAFKKAPTAAKDVVAQSLGRAIIEAGSTTGKAIAVEAVTEIFQTAVEENLSKLNTDFSGEKLFQAGIIGGATGGVISGSGATANVAAKEVKKTADKVEVATAKAAGVKAKQTEAATTGDLKETLDQSAEDFDLNTSIDTIRQRNTQEGVTQEEKQTNIAEATKLLQDTGSRLELLETQIEAETDTDAKVELVTERASLQEALSQGFEQYAQLQEQATLKDVEVDSAIETASPEAVQSVLNSARINPESVSVEQAERLLGSSSAAITPEVKQELQDHVAVQNAIKNIDDVNSDVIVGGVGFLGIQDYQNQISAALIRQDIPAAQTALDNLQKFSTRHNQKAGDVAQDPKNTAKFIQTIQGEATALSAAVVQGQNRIESNAFLVGTPVESVIEATQAQPEVADVQIDPDTFNALVADNAQEILDQVSSGTLTGDAAVEALVESTSSVTELSSLPTEERQRLATELVEATPTEPYSLSKRLTASEPDTSTTETEGKGVFSGANQVRKHFTNSTRSNVESPSVLQTKENVLATLTPNDVKEFTGQELTGGERNFMTQVKKIHTGLAKSFGELYKPRQKGYEYQDFMQYLANEDGSIDPNVVSAITLSTHNWLATQSAKTTFNNAESINGILGRQQDDPVSKEMYEVLGEVGVGKNTLAEAIGKQVTKSLGIKANPTAPGNYQTKLEHSLGAMAIATMLDTNLLTETRIKSSEIQSLVPSSEDTNDQISGEAEAVFYRVNSVRNEDTGYLEVHSAVAALIEGFKASNKLMERLFDIQSFATGYLTEAPTVPDNMKMKGTNQFASAEAKRAIGKHQKREHYKKDNMQASWNQLRPEQQAELAGAIEDVDTLHVNNRPGAVAKNQAAERGIGYLQEYHDNIGTGVPVFFAHEMWKNGRIGMIGNAFNPQASTLHRHFIKQSGWNTKVKLNDPTAVDNFMMAIAGALDLKLDKQSKAITVAQTKELIQSDLIQNAVTALNTETPTAEQQDDIMDAIRDGHGDAYSLDGLTNLAAYFKAIEDGATTFDSDLFTEVDGVTNGPIIGTLQLQAGKNRLDVRSKLNRGGIFFDGVTEDFGSWIADKANLDTYQDLAVKWGQAINEFIAIQSPENKGRMVAAKAIIGEYVDELGEVTKAGRNASKNPTLVTVYGSSSKSVLRTTSTNFIDTIYEDVEKAVQDNDITALNELAMNVNTFTGKEVLSYPNGLTGALDVIISTKDTELVRDAYSGTFGEALVNSLEDTFGDFQAKGKQINTAMNIVFEAFDLVYQDRLEARTAELVESGDIIPGETTLSQKDVRDIQNEIIALQPIMDNYFSAKADLEDQLREGTYVGKSDISRPFKKELNSQQNYARKPKNSSTKSISTRGTERILTAPGVSPAVLGVQSIDAATVVKHMEKYGFLNVHDAEIIGQGQVDELGQAMNQAFTDVNTDYSLLASASKSLNRALETLQEIDQEEGTAYLDTLTSDFGESLSKKDANDPAVANTPREFAERLQRTATAVDAQKAQDISEMTMQAQYFLPGSELLLNQSQVAPEEALTELSKAVTDTATNTPRSIREMDADTLGSAATGIDPDTFVSESTQEITNLNAEQVFDTLGAASKGVTESVEHGKYLRNLITNSITKVIRPFQLHEQSRTDSETVGATTGLDMYIINQIDNETNPASGSLANGIRMSAQEVYVHEMVHNITRAGVDGNTIAKRRLKKLYDQVKAEVTWQDFLNDPLLPANDPNYQREKDAAITRFNHVFKITSNAPVSRVDSSTGLSNVSQTSDYLHEFMALGMTNKNLRKKLAFIQADVSKENVFKGNALEVMGNIFEFIVNFFTGRIFGSNDVHADVILEGLFKDLASIERRAKTQLELLVDRGLTSTNAVLNAAILSGRGIVSKIAATPVIAQAKSPIVRAFGAVTKVVADDRSQYLAQSLQEYSEHFRRTQSGFRGLINSIITEVSGRTDRNGLFHDLNRIRNMTIDQQRAKVRDELITLLPKMFKDQGANLTESDKVAVTKAMLKTDIESLTGKYTLSQIERFLADNTTLNSEIDAVRIELDRFGNYRGFYKRSAAALGYHMATGLVGEAHVLLNAGQIAALTGTGLTQENQDNLDDATEIIDRLASLEAIKYTSIPHRDSAAKLFRTEAATGPQNGITFVLAQHKAMKEDASEELFKGHNAAIKGYTKETINPDIDVQYATFERETELVSKGYVKGAKPIARDPNDPNQDPIFQYINKHSGLVTYTTGIMSTTSKRSKGSDTINTRIQTGDELASLNGQLDVVKLRVNKKQAIRSMFNDTTTDFTKDRTNNMLPITNPNSGEVVGYRYVMSEQNKDDLLEKHNEFQSVMGATAANFVDKIASEEINNKTIQALYDQYQEDQSTTLGSYVEIGPRAKDTRYREIYYQMPTAARAKIKQVWGGKSMFVRADLIDLTFGQRKLSVQDSFNKDQDDRNAYESILVNTLGFLTRDKTGSRARTLEKAWQEIIKEVKDIIVIKTGVVTLANTASNMMSLRMLGVPFKDIARGHATAFAATVKYQNDERELNELTRVLNTGQAKPAEKRAVEERQAELRNELANSPVRELIEAGVFQTIIEDVDNTEENFNYKSKLQKVVTKYTPAFVEEAPESVKSIARNLFLTHDSKAYKVMNQAAQLSDFVARYTLHEHLTKRTDNRLSKKDSIAKIVSIFVDYDLPTHKSIQYGNDMGVFWFTKYNFRIQKIIAETFRENPARVLSLIALQGMIGDVPDLTDGSMLQNNPLNVIRNPLDQIDVLGEILTLNALDGKL